MMQVTLGFILINVHILFKIIIVRLYRVGHVRYHCYNYNQLDISEKSSLINH